MFQSSAAIRKHVKDTKATALAVTDPAQAREAIKMLIRLCTGDGAPFSFNMEFSYETSRKWVPLTFMADFKRHLKRSGLWQVKSVNNYYKKLFKTLFNDYLADDETP